MNMVCYQFLHEDFDKGMNLKKELETIMSFTQILIILLFIIGILITLYYDKTIGLISLLILSVLYSTRLLNPISMHVNLWNAQKQALFG